MLARFLSFICVSFLLPVPLFIVLLSLCPSRSAAYCPVPGLRANGEFFRSAAVFSGTVVSVREYADAGNDPGGWLYLVRVEQLFRGAVKDEITVYTEDTDVRFPLHLNQKYLLFAYRAAGRLEINSCGNSALLSDAGESLRRLAKLRQADSSAEIEGWVAAETSGIDVSGIQVSIRGRSKIYTAVTDKHGWFHVQVPPGKYQLDFTSNEYYLNTGDESWYKPSGFRLHRGECASLQVVSIRHRVE